MKAYFYIFIFENMIIFIIFLSFFKPSHFPFPALLQIHSLSFSLFFWMYICNIYSFTHVSVCVLLNITYSVYIMLFVCMFFITDNLALKNQLACPSLGWTISSITSLLQFPLALCVYLRHQWSFSLSLLACSLEPTNMSFQLTFVQSCWL